MPITVLTEVFAPVYTTNTSFGPVFQRDAIYAFNRSMPCAMSPVLRA